jgi:radical SAM-linked protein
MSFGPALPVGVYSEAEYFEFETTARLDPRDAAERIGRALPVGIRLVGLCEVRGGPGSADSWCAARYRVHLPEGVDPEPAVQAFLARERVEVVRDRAGRRTTFDLRREVLDIEAAGPHALRFTVVVREGAASVRPGEVLAEVLGERAEASLLVREDVLVEHLGRQVGPMLAAAAKSHAERAAR